MGYVNNKDKQSRTRYLQEQNNSVGTWLTTEGYHTAFLGKARGAGGGGCGGSAVRSLTPALR